MNKGFFGAILLLLAGVTACGEDTVNTGSGFVRKPAAQARPTDETADDTVPPALDFQENAFVESERSRDPFRSYAAYFMQEARGQVQSQREVVLEQYSIEDLRLVALVQRVHPAKAMLVDPTGMGHFVQRGQYIGRPSVVQPTGGGGPAYEVNWRVDRIRDGDLVLVRDDPSNPDVPSATRVIPLRTDDLSVSGSKDDSEGRGLEAEIREMKERLEKMAAAEAAKSRREENERESNP